MRALRLKIYQETACYRKPVAFKVGETYPLPPYSTIKGMIHFLMDATEFIPMRISVQGIYDTIIVDYQNHYFFKKEDVFEFPLVLDGLNYKPVYKKMTKMPLYTHILYNVHLIIHVEAEERILNKIINAILTKGEHLSLGRWEDLVRIDDFKIVETKHLSRDEEIDLKYNAYVPKNQLPEDTENIPYRLNWKYEIKNNVRCWEKINVGYVQESKTFVGPDLLIDEDNNPIFFNI